MNETAPPRGDARDRADDGTRDEFGATHVAASEAKATFSALIEGVQHRGERYVIERHGKPAAALVSVDELDRLGASRGTRPGMNGGLGLIGLLADYMTDEEIDEMVDRIYEDRRRNLPRPVDTSDWAV